MTPIEHDLTTEQGKQFHLSVTSEQVVLTIPMSTLFAGKTPESIGSLLRHLQKQLTEVKK